ncbi:sigma-70 family RNA polymerase sigma factor [Blastococcus sp. TF02A-26]|uniref:sigma-70 family RNA polymerase sigma factor n=1 Tax=Blastococcus sp. TF02A-26 TaxID=2250577 RepID=UPI000DE80BE2|nr:sigma-70 family RNA polymerase sigma factor [Blastococcus sp. TF02A-26]RBY82328.1 RNA polymerase subunit sigma-70 [Blastococcus sp. TF02A-26]
MASSRPLDERSAAVPEGATGLAPAPRRPSPRPRPTPHPRVSGESVAAPPRLPNVVADLAPLPAPAPTAPVGDAPEHTDPSALADDPTAEAESEAESEAEDAALTDALPDDQVDVWELVRLAQEGDAEAFGRLYDHYVTMVFRYLYHRVGDRTLAEDFTSETFVRALRRIDSLSFQGRDVGAWLVTIARNIVRDHVKSSRYRLEVATADMRDADRATEGPEDAVVSRLTHEQLLACVRQLGSEQQECISLRFLQGLSVAETAAVMGKKDGAIKALQHRAVRRLASLLPEGLR